MDHLASVGFSLWEVLPTYEGWRPESLGHFSLLLLGSDFVSAALGSPGTGARTMPGPERGVLKILSQL